MSSAAAERRAALGQRARPWVAWFAALAALTAAMFAARGTIDQAHVVLLYLLVVLGGSATGGRALGFALAAASFALVDYYFQLPFDTLGVSKPLDWVVLLAFFATAMVATQLLARARAEATEAQARATEIASLARLGAEALRVHSPADALNQVARTVAATLPVARCTIYPWNAETGLATGVSDAGALDASDDALLVLAAWHRRPTARLASGAAVEYPFIDAEHIADPIGTDVVTLLALPLVVSEQVLGVLHLSAPQGIRLEPASRRFLDALSYYAALATDRLRLARETERLEQEHAMNRVKDTVLASVSHDLRTPLTTIKALAGIAASTGVASAVEIEEQADRLTRLVDDLLDLSRFRADAFTASPEINAAEDLIGAAQRQTRGIADGRLVTRIDYGSSALLGRFDFVQTLRILANLIENAVRYAPSGEPVEVSAIEDGSELVLAVADRGPGIPPEEAERIFEPFYRARGSTADGHRSGLGLSIARRLAQIQQGTLTYAPRAGGGSVFTLRLPRFDADQPDDSDSAGLRDSRSIEAW